MKKKYCKDCEYLSRGGDLKHICTNIKNKKIINTYFERKSFIPHPSEINNKNNCKNFRRKINGKTEQI